MLVDVVRERKVRDVEKRKDEKERQGGREGLGLGRICCFVLCRSLKNGLFLNTRRYCKEDARKERKRKEK